MNVLFLILFTISCWKFDTDPSYKLAENPLGTVNTKQDNNKNIMSIMNKHSSSNTALNSVCVCELKGFQ